MADVIFNGSAARKPLGAASVEMVFDNSDGKIGGEYAAYNEVALRRAVTATAPRLRHQRTKVRRKDTPSCSWARVRHAAATPSSSRE